MILAGRPGQPIAGSRGDRIEAAKLCWSLARKERLRGTGPSERLAKAWERLARSLEAGRYEA